MLITALQHKLNGFVTEHRLLDSSEAHIFHFLGGYNNTPTPSFYLVMFNDNVYYMNNIWYTMNINCFAMNTGKGIIIPAPFAWDDGNTPKNMLLTEN